MDFAAFLFDMDGLLLDTEPLWDDVIDGFCRRRDRAYTAEDALACRGRGIEQCARYLKDKYGFAGDVHAHVDEIDGAFEARVGAASPMPGARDLLFAVAETHPTALGSSSARALIEAALGGRGWLPKFRAVVTGSDVVHKKPAPDIYLACAAKLGVHPTRCVVLEDSPVGSESGRRAGAYVVGVGKGEALAEHAHVVVPDLFAAAAHLGVVTRP